MSGYSQGRAIEYAVCHDLQDNGYDTVRAASSKGVADVIGFKGHVVLVNVKKTDPPGPQERADLLRVAHALSVPALPLVALGPASKLTYRRLTGPGPADWEPWTPDEIGRPTGEGSR